MGKRALATKLIDLLPDVLIEVQRADGISAEKALQRTVEDLAYNHGFFRVWLDRKYGEGTPKVGTPVWRQDGRIFFVDEASVLRVVTAFVDDRPFQGTLSLEAGRILATGGPWKEKGGDIHFLVELMPDLDMTFADPTWLTRERQTIVTGAIADLYGQPNRTWSNPDQYGLWRQRHLESLASWKTRAVVGVDGNRPAMSINPMGFL